MPKTRRYFACGVYILTLLSVTVLIYETGSFDSALFPLWSLVSFFAAVFGTWLFVVLLAFPGGYMAMTVLDGGEYTTYQLVTIFAIGFLPLVAGLLTWNRLGKSQSGSSSVGMHSAYKDLATELSQVANKSEVVINAIADGVVAIDSSGVIRLINPAAQELLGWGKQDATALSYKSVLQMLNKDNAEPGPAENPIEQVLSTNKAMSTSELSLKTNSGKSFVAAISVSPVGQIGSGVIVVFRNVSREKAEEREQAEFISTASHEMRTPVASIEGYLGLALNPNTAQVDEKARDYISKAQDAAKHLGRLFQDLLDVSKAEDGRLTNKPKVIDLVPFIRDIAVGLAPKAEEKGLTFLFKPQPLLEDAVESTNQKLSPVFYVNLDGDHIREIVSNLIENAIKYTLSGNVTVDIGGDEDSVLISVQDSGLGIPAEDISHLFQKFYRVDSSDTREIGGTGLGLYLCRRLAEAMGGRVFVESEYKKGSTFYLELPRITHEEAMRRLEQATMYEQSEITEVSTVIADNAPHGGFISPATSQPSQTTPAGLQPQPTPAPIPTQTPEVAAPAPISIPVQHYTEPPMVNNQVEQPPIEQPVAQPAPVQQPPQPMAQIPTQRSNISLSSIERNPEQYTQVNRQVIPPVRNDNGN